MVPYLGDFKEDDTILTVFNTFTSNDPSASCTITNFINTDVHIHKEDDLTQRNNAAGITVSVDFDGITGSHMIKIDTSDDTVAGFWVIAKDYFVRIEGTTIDGATINVFVAHFSIENRFNEVDLTHILGHLLTQTGTQLADGFQTFFDTANPTTMLAINLPNQTMDVTGDITGNLSGSVGSLTGHTAQTGDSFARIGATGSGLTSLALASVLGALNDVAADGDPTNADTLVQYVKQLINVLIGTAGVVAFPAEAAPANAVSLAEVIRAIHVDVTGIGGITPPTKAEMDTAHALLATPAQVNTQVSDVIKTDTKGEPAQGAPGATLSLEDKIAFIYKFLRNKIDNDGSTIQVYNDAGAVVDQKSTCSEVAGTVTRGEFVSGP